MPENVPPKETAKADGLSPTVQAPGVPRESIKGDAPAPAPAVAPDPNARPGKGFVRIRWKEKIGGHEQDEEWAEERRAHNLVGSGHAEIVEPEDKAK